MCLFKCITGLVSEKPIASQRVNESQKLLQYAEKNFYPTFSSFSAIIELEKVIFNQIWDFRTAW